ncbi:crotonobetainyl-CoA:carnitine CoA-transferase CaiB-like acyl-CoA transferase [Arcanobacterium wilhelmae]|uniref:Crotonobetainyl-CoA:carnitine CoA-transferase CaiB-like acyl-CoA transferase n=1 Tax=Arcanobacterium wilhelmae TaxID=1803177 RepID=A0ABT9NAP3_9ACTO|nr:CaiB/BaiF CoA-transferase family protein [Arcanobacterium wilhelmae]MDP9800756.1 crotonobetainyl-CoA:carnitine CoA-transferase CaiB-like acyl-CoA transferase [Arcanobacterium wilhelmae]
MDNKPLAGVKVIDFSNYAAAPAAARVLADWGAEVIKVENPRKDPIRAWSAATCGTPTREENPIFHFENTNKLGMSINTKSEAGMEIMDRLLSEADIFLSNFRLGALEKMGYDYETMHAKYPKLIWAHVSGLGNEGPEAFKPGFDITSYWSRSGALLDPAEKDTYPNISPYGAGDHSVSLALVSGMLAALIKQRTTGEGSKVTTSLLGTAIWNYAMLVISTQYADVWPKTRFEPATPINAAYRCSDGEWFMLTVIEYERQYNTVMEVLGLTDLIDSPEYSTVKAVQEGTRRADLTRVLDAEFAKKTRPEWVELFNAADVPNEMIRHFKDVKDDPQGWANGNLVDFEFENGHHAVIPALPVQIDSTEAPEMKAAPHLGQHNREVMASLGYSAEEIDQLYADGVLVDDAQ